MSFQNLDKELLLALRTRAQNRTVKELSVIYSYLRRLDTLLNTKEQGLRTICSTGRYEAHEANEILFRKDDPCRCWYILMTGAVFIQGTMFVPHACFGKQIPGTKRRGSQCLVLEPSEMIAVDYPDMTFINSRPPFRLTSTNSAGNTLGMVVEVDSSSSESSPTHQPQIGKSANGQISMLDNGSQSSLTKDLDDDEEDEDQDLDEDSLSLHSNSSLVIKDHVIDVLKNNDRRDDDLDILLEFTKSLRAFANMTEPTRRALCKVMVFAWIEKEGTEVLKDGERLDSWSVIINGHVQVRDALDDKPVIDLYMGDSFGVDPSEETQFHEGSMYTMCDDCQFLCVAQQEYYDVMHKGLENIEEIKNETGDVVLVKEKREFDGGARKGTIVIRGKPDSLMRNLLDDNSIDATYIEDYLLTYRAFNNEPLKTCSKLLEWFDNSSFRDKVVHVILLWVNNHFNDFEKDRHMMALLEKFEDKLHINGLHGQMRLFNIACQAKARSRTVTITRPKNDTDLGFEIEGGRDNYPNYISRVKSGSAAENKGIKRGDLLLEVNGQNFEKLSRDKANAILNKNTELNMTLKTSLFAFKQMLEDLSNPQKKKKGKHDGKVTHAVTTRTRVQSVTTLPPMDAFESKITKGGTLGRARSKAANKIKKMFRMDGSYTDFYTKHTHSGMDPQMSDDVHKGFTIGTPAVKENSRPLPPTKILSTSDPDICVLINVESTPTETPKDVIKVYRADQSHRFVCVGRDTTASDAVAHACKEFMITDNVENYALYRVSVQGEKFIKQSKLPDPLANLANIPLGSRYYLKSMMNSEQLLPDENIPELLKEANFSFLDLNSFEVALYLTREDYKMFQGIEPANFIEDLFNLDGDLEQYRKFEDLVNRELFWVVTTMCNEPNVIQRSKIIKHFIKIAHHCKILKNLNSAFAIVSGLGYRAVSRMKQTWEKVPAKSARQFEDLQALMDPSRNMSKYRTLLSEYTSQPPVLPYIPVVKKDLTFLHLGNDTKVEGLINFEKMRMIGKEVRNICRLCAPDSSLIIPTAQAAHQRDTDRGGIYTTLTRRGRRSSFNNVRRLYEDQVNVRRVKQYMQQIEIITDEDKLVEMSKAVEPPVANTSDVKRTNKVSDSPSRSTSRSSSEQQLVPVPTITLQTRRKVPVSSLPKFGAQSPQALKKMLALSEDGGGSDRSGSDRSRDVRRSESASSHDLSPAPSPYMSPKHERLKKNQSGHSVAMENANKNNNRLSLPPASACELPSPGIQSAPASGKRFFPVVPSSGSAPSSSRSSIASTSSLGTYSSSNPVHSSTSSLCGNSSPRSSPLPWGSLGSVHSTTSASPRLVQNQHKNSNSPVRTSSSSSADTVKSSGSKYHERPVIKQSRNGRSGSFGGVMVMAGKSDRRLTHISTSASTPSLSAGGVSQASLILPNHPQIPRTPSNDSGMISAGSLSADSVSFNTTDDAEIFRRALHQSHHPHPAAFSGRYQDSQAHPSGSGTAVSRHHHESGDRTRQRPPSASFTRGEQPEEGGDKDKVEQTFLSGFRGQGDPPRPDNKDPYMAHPTTAPPFVADDPRLAMDYMALYPGHIPPGLSQYAHHQRYHAPHPKTLGGGAFRGIHEYLICERHAAMQRQRRVVMASYAQQVVQFSARSGRMKTPESILEEQLLLELQQQGPTVQKPRRKASPPRGGPERVSSTNLVDLRRLSLSKSDPSLRDQQPPSSWPAQDPGYPSPVDVARPTTVRLPYHARTSSPKLLLKQNSLENNLAPCSPVVETAFAPSIPADYRRLSHPFTVQASYSRSSTVEDGGPAGVYTNEQGYEWQYPDRLSQSVVNPATAAHDVSARLNATAPTPARNRQGALRNEKLATNSPVLSRNLDLPLPPRQDYTPETSSGGGNRTPFQGRKKTNDEWSETDLDSEKLQQTMRAWGSSASLPATSSVGRVGPVELPSPATCKPPTPVLPCSPYGFPGPRRSNNKLPPPLPPQRSSSIGRTRQLRLGSGSSSPTSPPLSPAASSDLSKPFDESIPPATGRLSLPLTSPMANGHVVQHRSVYAIGSQPPTPSNERKSLPTYTEAVKQISARQKNMFPSPLPSNYRPFIDPHDNKEQVSQV